MVCPKYRISFLVRIKINILKYYIGAARMKVVVSPVADISMIFCNCDLILPNRETGDI